MSDGGPPSFPAARQHLFVELVRFVSKLRSEGVSVPTSGTIDAARALAAVGLGEKRPAADALRACLLADPADGEAFDEAFETFWHRLKSGFDRIGTAEEGPTADSGADAEGDEGKEREGSEASEADRLPEAEAPPTDDDGDGDVSIRIPTDRAHVSGDRAAETGGDSRRYSAVGGSDPVGDAPSPPEAELAAVDRFVDALGTRPGRRTVRDRTGEAVDARGALRASLQTGGAPLELPYVGPAPTELRCCLLVDVSGSVLDTIDRGAVLALAERLVARSLSARVFLFDTDLIEATAPFSRARGDPTAALRAAEIEWGGGTQIGDALETVRREFPDAVDRRTTVVVVSDGLDVGDPDRLASGITWLADRASTVVWLNPLAASPAFEPASRGMSTVLPYVDALFGFAEAADLAAAAEQIERRGLSGGVGYEHDRRRIERGRSDG